MARQVTRKPQSKESIATQTAIDRAVSETKKTFGTEYYSCYLCGNVFKKDGFYKDTDPRNATGISRICKQCAEKLVYEIDSEGKRKFPTKESIKTTLEYLNKPWKEDVFEASIKEAENKLSGKVKSDVWNAYIKNISMRNYRGMCWKDGDIERNQPVFSEERDVSAKEVQEMYETNKKTVIKAVGYDPFETALESDKPLMYNMLCGFLDESTNEDQMKLSACVEITQSFTQAERLNHVINGLQQTVDSIIANAAKIKSLEETKNKIFSSALDLAKDNGISFKHSNNNSKGANTWTGKVKELKEMDLRSAELNAFDIGTSQGMQQVAEISANAIAKQLAFDENDYTDIIKTQRELITKLQSEVDLHNEEYRILKRENNDLKDFLREKGLINEQDEVIL